MKYLILVTSALITSLAYACPRDQAIDFTFARDMNSPEGLVIKRNINGENKEELLDTTGYAGFILTASRFSDFYSPMGPLKVSDEEKAETTRFFRLQAKKLSRYLGKVNKNSPAIAKLGELDKALEANPPDNKKFSELWFTLTEMLKKEPDIAKIQYRASGAKEWNPTPDAVSGFTLWGECRRRCPCAPGEGKFDYKSGNEAFFTIPPTPKSKMKPTTTPAAGSF